MKKIIAVFLTLSLFFALCACGAEDSEKAAEKQGNGISGKAQADGSGGQTEKDQMDGNLHLLGNPFEHGEGCYTENGFYYMTEDISKLSDGSYGAHLMYMDFATRQEIYLCSNTGCTHNSPDCPSVFRYEEFPDDKILFVYGDSLYILSKKFDMDGSMSISITGDGGVDMAEGSQDALYRTNLDGTGREKIYSFDGNVTLENVILGDENGIYVVTKKMIAEKGDDGAVFNNSSERKLIFVDFKSKKEKEICSLDFNDNISWKIIGCCGQNLVLCGDDFGREISNQERFDDDAYFDLYDNSNEVFATLDISNGKLTERCRISNKEEHSALVDGSLLYLSSRSDGSIKTVDLISGEERLLCTLEQSYLYGMIGDKLCCHTWDWTSDSAFYYVDKNTGESSRSSLVNKRTGWSLEFRAETEEEALVIYDYEAVQRDKDTYEISRYQYGLISKEDLYAGKDAFSPIQMVEGGM